MFLFGVVVGGGDRSKRRDYWSVQNFLWKKVNFKPTVKLAWHLKIDLEFELPSTSAYNLARNWCRCHIWSFAERIDLKILIIVKIGMNGENISKLELIVKPEFSRNRCCICFAYPSPFLPSHVFLIFSSVLAFLSPLHRSLPDTDFIYISLNRFSIFSPAFWISLIIT